MSLCCVCLTPDLTNYIRAQISELGRERLICNVHVYITGCVAWCGTNSPGLEQTVAGEVAIMFLHHLLL